ncbi:hypothetical protein B0T26DRAFT_332330 [Lasiosphaeria miniovina]|uniref:Uncharacterized protein n=1 Tax=Lasiosphaeria miniovina TaxID=1954250 RepID=A0AA40DW24_9PEZI|nr:uncharacterized protein B0T26DRAFT_332330 [Lasiosphaeria miniovina]KAK0718504.1 hypothetical protein B0T26DRAFT_332330 [Lasiosphaeria miniovina]
MEPSVFAAAELDAGDVPVRLSLASSPSPFTSTPQHREIFVRRHASAGNSREVGIVERTFSVQGGATLYDSERFLNLRDDSFIPLYVQPEADRAEWKVELGFGRGTVPVQYPFRTRSDALRFQQFLTGYETVAHFEDVACVVTYKGWRIAHPQYAGVGEIQLWRQAKTSTTSGLLTPTSSRSSFSTQQRSSVLMAGGLSPTSARPMSIASVQSMSSLVRTGTTGTVQTHGARGTPVYVNHNDRPPLLVAFLKDRGKDGGYAMLKANITNLVQSEFTNGWEEALLRLTARGEPTFRVDKHLPEPGQDRLSSWNLCGPRKTTKKKTELVDHLECTHLALNFASRKDPANLEKRESLDRQMLMLQAGQLQRLAGETVIRDREISERSREMRTPMPSQLSLAPPTSTPTLTPRSSRYNSFLEPLPEIQRESTYIGTDFIMQSGNSRPAPEAAAAAVTAELEAQVGQGRGG